MLACATAWYRSFHRTAGWPPAGCTGSRTDQPADANEHPGRATLARCSPSPSPHSSKQSAAAVAGSWPGRAPNKATARRAAAGACSPPSNAPASPPGTPTRAAWPWSFSPARPTATRPWRHRSIRSWLASSSSSPAPSSKPWRSVVRMPPSASGSTPESASGMPIARPAAPAWTIRRSPGSWVSAPGSCGSGTASTTRHRRSRGLCGTAQAERAVAAPSYSQRQSAPAVC
jgi:hypothetical protein